MNIDPRRTRARKRLLLEYLAQTRGIISPACKRAGIARRTFYYWLETDKEFYNACVDIDEESVDFVESKLMDRIDAGSEKAIFFYLRTRGRARGYRLAGESASDLLSDDLLTTAMRSNRFNGTPPLEPSPARPPCDA